MAKCASRLTAAYLEDGPQALRKVGIVDKVAHEAEQQGLQGQHKLRPIPRAQLPCRLPQPKPSRDLSHMNVVQALTFAMGRGPGGI